MMLMFLEPWLLKCLWPSTQNTESNIQSVEPIKVIQWKKLCITVTWNQQQSARKMKLENYFIEQKRKIVQKVGQRNWARGKHNNRTKMTKTKSAEKREEEEEKKIKDSLRKFRTKWIPIDFNVFSLTVFEFWLRDQKLSNNACK